MSRSENVLDASRDDLFDARLYRVMNARGIAGLGALVAKLKTASDPALDQEVVEAMTINETSFFRDRAAFELLQNTLIPHLIESRSRERCLRFWSAACSSGQEAYSLAMLLRQNFPQIADWQIEICGTDINMAMVRRARAGRYSRIEINRGLPARMLLKYFVRDGEEWELTSELRAICNFQQCNLSHSLPILARYDGILMRNVLFYFPESTQKRILQQVHRMLQKDGFLLLGSSEQAQPRDLWHPVFENNTCYYKRQ
ncbi:MAG TPA: protein-glutamate O-methyltransferase CheR [Alloacidobacterium sp.]|nr:protein-glutamate O-methyltransferase CheR [Alloacidobacterium sp.]